MGWGVVVLVALVVLGGLVVLGILVALVFFGVVVDLRLRNGIFHDDRGSGWVMSSVMCSTKRL